jgi:predicted ArsR family transcriptional regulator
MPLESSPESGASRQRGRILDDPVAIRALAHPLRNDLMRIIGRRGRTTTAEAARELGISHGLASHHLHQLAKYDFVEQIEGNDNRERPWRLVATSYEFRPATAAPAGMDPAGMDPAGMDAVDVVERVHAEQALTGFLRWQQRRKDWPADWLEQSGILKTTVYLTQNELAGLATAINDLLERYVGQRPLDDLAARPARSVPVDFTIFAVPTAAAPPTALEL